MFALVKYVRHAGPLFPPPPPPPLGEVGLPPPEPPHPAARLVIAIAPRNRHVLPLSRMPP
jgi:hypothetical protein